MTDTIESLRAQVAELIKHNGLLGREVKDLTRQRDGAINQLYFASSYVDILGGDSKGYRSYIAAIKESQS